MATYPTFELTRTWTDPNRTAKQAVDQLLGARLKFGEEWQLEDLDIIRLAELLIEFERECPFCHGEGELEGESGYCDKCGRECESCAEATHCDDCDGTGTQTWKRHEAYALTVKTVHGILYPPAEQPKAA